MVKQTNKKSKVTTKASRSTGKKPIKTGSKAVNPVAKKKSAVKTVKSSHQHTLKCKPVTRGGKQMLLCTVDGSLPATKARASSSKATAAKRVPATTASDGPYFMRLTILALLGLVWLKISFGVNGLQLPLPIGFAVGLMVAAQQPKPLDRKITFVVLLAALLVGFISPFGIYINL